MVEEYNYIELKMPGSIWQLYKGKKKKKNRAKSWTESQDFPRCFKVVPGNTGYNLKATEFFWTFFEQTFALSSI